MAAKRTLFVKLGDCNTHYFHNKASHRYKRNRIHGLRNKNNEWCTSDHQIAEIVVNFYEYLFTSSQPSAMHAILEVIETKVMEVELVLKHMEPLKAPGLDCMPPIFFQSFWSMVGDDMSYAVLDCLNKCHIPHDLNHTLVTLIPKVKSSEFIYEFRPISLCNVIYKLISKVLANRLKKLLPFLVSENQSAF